MHSNTNNQLAINTYNHIADTYAHLYFDDLTDSPYLDKFLTKLPVGARVLDVGAGAGQFTKYMLEKGFDATGIDFSKSMLAKAKQLVPNGEFVYMDMRHLNFPAASFDGILVAYSLIHIPTAEIPSTLIGFHEVLRPGGHALFITQKGEADQLVDEPLFLAKKMFFNFFTKKRLADLLQAAMFEILFQDEVDSLDPISPGDQVIYTLVRS